MGSSLVGPGASRLAAWLVLLSLGGALRAGPHSVGLAPPNRSLAALAPRRAVSPPLTSLPAPAATGPRRILLVDDDPSDNNYTPGDSRRSHSDQVFRQLVGGLVGGDAQAWDVEEVPVYGDGPGLERLRPFTTVLWYTGASYGGNADNTSVLSVRDEATVRAYLDQVGGAVILVSPGYLSKVLGAYGTWEDSSWPNLTGIFGIRGGLGLAQRFQPGTVVGPSGTRLRVQSDLPVETQFSVANPDGAAVVFTTEIESGSRAGPARPVATAHASGRGRAVYVGFSLENMAPADREPAFRQVMAASGWTAPETGSAAAMPPATAPGPANLEIESSWPSAHALRWLTTGVYRFEVYRRQGTGWQLLRGGFPEQFYTDHAFVAPGSAYRVDAIYPDGRRGRSVVEYPNPPQPGRPAGLTARQVGAGKVNLSWQPMPGVENFLVTGPGAAAAGIAVRSRIATDVVDVPLGEHEFRVAAVYGTLTAPSPSTVRAVVNPDRGRYRVVLRGLQVIQGTKDDDLFHGDGRGDEVYVAAMWATASTASSFPAGQGHAVVGGFVRSKLLGDTQGYPDRLAVGSANGTWGGLKTGDWVPSASIQQPEIGVVAASDRLPMLLFEGELRDSGEAVAVLPCLFEWDRDHHGAWNQWADWWAPGGAVLQDLGVAMRQRLSPPLATHKLFGMIASTGGDIPRISEYSVAAGRDRPLGLHVSSRPGYTPAYSLEPRGLVLTRGLAEQALAGRSAMALPIEWGEWGTALGGVYTGWLQLERLSAAPLVLSAPPPLAGATVTMLQVPVAMGTLAPPPAPTATPTPTPTQTAAPTPTPMRVQASARSTGGQALLVVPEAAPGPPPRNLSFRSESPVRHYVSWVGDPGASFDVYRRVGDAWVLVVGGTSFTTALDAAFVAPGTGYEVVARYADGRQGRTPGTFANPSQPRPIENLKVEQVGEDAVKLSWTRPSEGGSSKYRVFSPGGPAAGLEVPWTVAPASVVLTQQAPGLRRYRVASQYGTLVEPVGVAVTATVAPWSGTYRLVLLGFRAARRTPDDDILDGDGKGDEVFVGAFRAQLPASGTRAVSLGAVRSLVMGDDRLHPARVRAGSASPTGGIVTGDVIPSDAAMTWAPGRVAHADRLPMLLWQGRLTKGGDGVVVLPVAFEWDDAASTQPAWSSWQDFWGGANGLIHLGEKARAEVAAHPGELRRTMLTGTYTGRYLDRVDMQYPICPSYPFAPGKTRGLGLLKHDDMSWLHPPYGWVLTFPAVEAVLGGAATTTRGFEWDDNDLDLWVSATTTRAAAYVATLALERVGP